MKILFLALVVLAIVPAMSDYTYTSKNKNKVFILGRDDKPQHLRAQASVDGTDLNVDLKLSHGRRGQVCHNHRFGRQSGYRLHHSGQRWAGHCGHRNVDGHSCQTHNSHLSGRQSGCRLHHSGQRWAGHCGHRNADGHSCQTHNGHRCGNQNGRHCGGRNSNWAGCYRQSGCGSNKRVLHHGAVVSFENLGHIKRRNHRFLDSDVNNGDTRLVPTTHRGYNGTHWKVIPNRDGTYSFKSLAAPYGYYAYLHVHKEDTTVRLGAAAKTPGKYGKWHVRRYRDGSFSLRNIGSDLYLDGHTIDGTIGLSAHRDRHHHSGTHWLIRRTWNPLSWFNESVRAISRKPVVSRQHHRKAPIYFKDGDVISLRNRGLDFKWRHQYLNADTRSGDFRLVSTLDGDYYTGAKWQVFINQDGSYALKTLNLHQGKKVWLAAHTRSGQIALTSDRLWSAAKWKVEKFDDGTFAFLSLAKRQHYRHQYLDGLTRSGLVKLAPNTGRRFSGTHWEVKLATAPVAPTPVQVPVAAAAAAPTNTVTVVPNADVLKSGTIVSIRSQNNNNQPARFLDSVTSNGQIKLSPRTDGVYTGTHWRVYKHKDGSFSFKTMGKPFNKSFRYLDGRTNNGSLGLSPANVEPYTGARWSVEAQVDGSYALKNLGKNANASYVYVEAQNNNNVALTANTSANPQGTRWVITKL